MAKMRSDLRQTSCRATRDSYQLPAEISACAHHPSLLSDSRSPCFFCSIVIRFVSDSSVFFFAASRVDAYHRRHHEYQHGRTSTSTLVPTANGAFGLRQEGCGPAMDAIVDQHLRDHCDTDPSHQHSTLPHPLSASRAIASQSKARPKDTCHSLKSSAGSSFLRPNTPPTSVRRRSDSSDKRDDTTYNAKAVRRFALLPSLLRRTAHPRGCTSACCAY